MKLRTKLVLVSATVLFLASGLSGAAMMADTLRFHEVQAAESGRAQLTAAANAIGSQMESSRILEYGEVTRTAYFHFLLDKYDASRFLLLENDIVLCNQTDYEFVEGGTEGWNGEEVQSLIQKTDGRRLLICGRRIPMETMDAYSLVMIQDISGIYQDALRRIPVLAAICLTASLAASAALSLLARRLLSPLEQLRCAAVRISEGDMSCRAPISGHDEITALACAFNHMADRVEEQMELLNRAAEQRTQLLGSLTHEIKTPMTSIIGYADTLLHVHLSEDGKTRALRHIYEEGRRLERLSSKLMLLIGLYENDSLQMEETELSELFERVRRLETCQLKHQEMVLEVSSFSGTRRVDADLFESLLVNLIDNAIRAGHRGGRIRLIRLAQDGRRGERILVQDDGKGIPPEEMEKITQPFYMVDKSRSRKEGGAGLGLALCSRIAALHNLRLSIESQLEEGTTVTLEFPTGSTPENGDSPS